nr:hypothetical protein [uncultured Prevotella sp.]
MEIKEIINQDSRKQRRFELTKDIFCTYLQTHPNVALADIAKLSIETADMIFDGLETNNKY